MEREQQLQQLQNDRNLGMLGHGLVMATGFASIFLWAGGLGLLALLGALALYFVQKPRSAFVAQHAKQAAGVLVLLFALGLVLGMTMAGMAGILAFLPGGAAASLVLYWIVRLVGVAVGVGAIVLGWIGLQRAQRGEAFLYPVLGPWLDRLAV